MWRLAPSWMLMLVALHRRRALLASAIERIAREEKDIVCQAGMCLAPGIP